MVKISPEIDLKSQTITFRFDGMDPISILINEIQSRDTSKSSSNCDDVSVRVCGRVHVAKVKPTYLTLHNIVLFFDSFRNAISRL